MSNPIVVVENFTINELMCKCGCKRFNYSREFLITLQNFRYSIRVPLIVTSGCRCVAHNKKTGGKSTSCHECETKQASAIDITCQDMGKAFALAEKQECFNEIIWYTKSNFIHLGIDKKQGSSIYSEKINL